MICRKSRSCIKAKPRLGPTSAFSESRIFLLACLQLQTVQNGFGSKAKRTQDLHLGICYMDFSFSIKPGLFRNGFWLYDAWNKFPHKEKRLLFIVQRTERPLWSPFINPSIHTHTHIISNNAVINHTTDRNQNTTQGTQNHRLILTRDKGQGN